MGVYMEIRCFFRQSFDFYAGFELRIGFLVMGFDRTSC